MSKGSKPVTGQAGSLGFTFVAAVGFVYMVAVLFSEIPYKRDRQDHDDDGAG